MASDPAADPAPPGALEGSVRDRTADPIPSSRRPNDVRWGLVDVVAGWVVAIFASSVAVGALAESHDVSNIRELPVSALVLGQLPMWGVMLGTAVFATRIRGRRSLRLDIGLAHRWWDIPLGVAAGLAAQLFVVPAVYVPLFRSGIVDPDSVSARAEDLADSAATGTGVVLLVAMVVVAAPVVEEIFYRGLLLRALEHHLAPAVAGVGSALVFGAVHFSTVELPALIAFGLILAGLAVWTGRLGASIWAHVAFNLHTLVRLLW